MIIQNKTSDVQCIAGIPAFGANEERVVSEEEGRLILRNPHFEEVFIIKNKGKEVKVVKDV